MRKAVNILCIVMLSACNRRASLSPTAYIRNMETKEFKKEIEIGKTEYIFQLATPEYMAIKEATGSNGIIKTDAIKRRVEDMKGYIFLLIRINKKPVSSLQSTSNDAAITEQKVMYYQSAQQDISLVDGGSTYKPVVYQFENNYGLSPYNTIIVGFEHKEPIRNEIQFVFNDRFEHNPLIKASFSEQALTILPTLSINNIR